MSQASMSRKQFREDRQGIKTEPGLKAATIVVNTRDDNNLEEVQGIQGTLDGRNPAPVDR